MPEKDVEIKQNFACTVEFVEAENSAYARLHVASQDVDWEEEYPVTIDYLSLFISLKLEGSHFDALTLTNTESVAKENTVTIVKQDENETQKKSASGIKVGLDTKGPMLSGNLDDAIQNGEKIVEKIQGDYTDLICNLHNRDVSGPEWKVSTRNKNSLALSQSNRIKLGKYVKLKGKGDISVSGHTRTGPLNIGFKVTLNSLPTRCKYLGGDNLWRQIIEKRIGKYLAKTRIPIEQVIA
jgi:hypothetical protein